jgi:hypothetical protein
MPTIAEIIAAKKAAAAAPPPPTPGKSSSLVLNRAMPEPATTEKGVPADEAPRAPEPIRRSLIQREGEAFPMLATDADEEAKAWDAATNAFDTDLCVMRDPNDPEVCWLAARPARRDLQPVLIHRLPWLLWEHPATVAVDNSNPY